MIDFNKIEIGDKVFVLDFRGVWEGSIVAKNEKESSWTKARVCVKGRGNDLTVITELASLFSTQREAYLHKGQKLQNEASQKLNEAADAFKRAGVPEETEEDTASRG